ncbi:MAG: DUF971 domain-containing protein [Polyangiales bacterium]
MTATPRTIPTELRAPRGARTLEIDFADGHRAIYPHEILRGYCPCAVCQGHQGPIRFVPGGDLELTDISEVGDYALGLRWGDGHATGIYTFAFLRELCGCSECLPDAPEAREFSRGGA